MTLLEVDRSDLIVKSKPFVRAIDDIQYGLGEGPCISAAATGETKRSGQLDVDPRWPRFGPQAGALGVHSALSLPLKVPTGVLGALNVYAHHPEAFDEDSQRCGENFAQSASPVVHNAHVLDRTARLLQQLRDGFRDQGLLDQAVGVIRRRSGTTADEAVAELLAMSERQQVPLAEMAARVVDGSAADSSEIAP